MKSIFTIGILATAIIAVLAVTPAVLTQEAEARSSMSAWNFRVHFDFMPEQNFWNHKSVTSLEGLYLVDYELSKDFIDEKKASSTVLFKNDFNVDQSANVKELCCGYWTINGSSQVSVMTEDRYREWLQTQG